MEDYEPDSLRVIFFFIFFFLCLLLISNRMRFLSTWNKSLQSINFTRHKFQCLFITLNILRNAFNYV